jgi:hypothetical protein
LTFFRGKRSTSGFNQRNLLKILMQLKAADRRFFRTLSTLTGNKSVLALDQRQYLRLRSNVGGKF